MTPFDRPAGAFRAGRPATAQRPAKTGAAPARDKDGFFFFLILLYLFFEYGRPDNPMKIPMLVSILSFAGWVARGDKKWTPQSTGFVVFLGLMIVGIPIAGNRYWAFWQTYEMAVILLSICLPLPSLVTSVRRVRLWINMFVAVSVYVAIWALLHGGYGPSAARGGQDENYTAAMMGMAIPFAYFSILATRGLFKKMLFGLAILLCVGSTLAAIDVSRGGFLGICAAFLYCLMRSPRKWVALGLIVGVCLILLIFAGPAYWEEISTISDVHQGTADERLDLWAIGMRMFRAHPILGIGPASFKWTVGEFQSEEELVKYHRNLGGTKVLHSLFVELLAEMGLTGAVVLAALLWRTRRDLRSARRHTTSGSAAMVPDSDRLQLTHYADAVTGSILACLVNGVFLSLLYFSYLWFLLALGGAIARVARGLPATRPLTESAQ